MRLYKAIIKISILDVLLFYSLLRPMFILRPALKHRNSISYLTVAIKINIDIKFKRD